MRTQLHAQQYDRPKKNLRGQAMLLTVFFFLIALLSLSLGFSSIAMSEEAVARSEERGARSYFLAEAGQEDATYRVLAGKNISAQEIITLNGQTATTSIAFLGSDRVIESRGEDFDNIRKVTTKLTVSDTVAFPNGILAGALGLDLFNSSSINGNVYSNGKIEGTSDNYIRGTAISAGPNGLIDDIRATSSAYAHTIRDSFLEKDAYYQTLTNTVVLGTQYPGSTDQSMATFPISDALIDEWEQAAQTGGVISGPCPYKIKNTTVTLGPVKIACNKVDIETGADITLAGPVWVTGDVDIENNAILRVSSSLGNKSVAFIADNVADRINLGQIEVENSAQLVGNGQPNSFVALISQRSAAEQGQPGDSLDIENSVTGDVLLYAAHGRIEVENNAVVTAIAGYEVDMKNNTAVQYKQGIASILFDSGPGSGFSITEWKETE